MEGLSIDEAWDYIKVRLCESPREACGSTQGRNKGDAWWDDGMMGLKHWSQRRKHGYAVVWQCF